MLIKNASEEEEEWNTSVKGEMGELFVVVPLFNGGTEAYFTGVPSPKTTK